MFLNRGLLFAAAMSGIGLLAAGCGPTYPKCENDDHCSDKGEYCLNGMCQQCRDSSHCDEGFVCNAGQCARPEGYCDDSTPCPGNQKCRDNRCGAECMDNSECGAGQICKMNACVAKPECGEGADNPTCPEGQECMDGRCQVQIVQCGGGVEPVLYNFNQSDIRRDQRGKLDKLAECLQQPNTAAVTLVGHCDERGTEEYNLALGERRAESAKRYLGNKGVDASKVSTNTRGEAEPVDDGHNERAWKKNRRTEYR